ncbi:MAG TPA: hypothetical protein VGK58_11805, partial [Lacipirellulaceae bacterium]
MDSVYVETTIVGHIAGRVHPDPIVAIRQQITRDWWRNEASGYEIFISQVVLEECSQGDPSAAAERRRPGPAPRPLADEVVLAVVTMATDNPWYGYKKIAIMCRRARAR